MSQENVEVVRNVVEAQQRRDWQAFRMLYDPGIEWYDDSGLLGGLGNTTWIRGRSRRVGNVVRGIRWRLLRDRERCHGW